MRRAALGFLAIFLLLLLSTAFTGRCLAQAPAPPRPAEVFDHMQGMWFTEFEIRIPDVVLTGYQVMEVVHVKRQLTSKFLYHYVENEVLPIGIGENATIPHVKTSDIYFTLSDEGKKGYRLDIRTERDSMAVEGLRLRYSPERGFAGEGVGAQNGEQIPVSVSIVLNPDGTHTWTVRQKAPNAATPESELNVYYELRFGKTRPKDAAPDKPEEKNPGAPEQTGDPHPQA